MNCARRWPASARWPTTGWRRKTRRPGTSSCRRIAASQARASRLVDQLLALALARKPKASCSWRRWRWTSWCATRCCASCRAPTRPAWTWARVGIDPPAQVLGDATLIDGILNNLLDNALRYGVRRERAAADHHGGPATPRRAIRCCRCRTTAPACPAILRLDRVQALADVYASWGDTAVDREDEMVSAFDFCLHGRGGAAPSIDTAMHALVDADHVDHLHPDSGIALATAADGERLTSEIFGDKVGLGAVASPRDSSSGWTSRRLKRDHPEAIGTVLGGHGITALGHDQRGGGGGLAVDHRDRADVPR